MPIDSASRAVNDPTRLAALEALAVLDSPSEPGFDDIVHMAARACRTPVALVSLVAVDRQWFKANVGFPHCETDLNSSVCAHALGEADLLIIPDLAIDPRTADNPLVTGEPFIRFYAGAPLRLASGEVLGSLCVIDRKPRPRGLAPEQADTLRRLARQVMAQFELRRAVNERDVLLSEQRSAIREHEAQTRTQVAVSASGGDLDIVLDALVSGALEAVPAAEAAVMELMDGVDLEYRAVRGSIEHHLGLRVPVQGSLAGHCASTKVPLIVGDVLKDGRVKKDLIQTLDLRSAVLAPVSRGDTVLGVLKLQSSKPDAFTERDLELARHFACLATAGLTEVSEFQAQCAVLLSEARYRAVFESAADYAIVVTDLGGRITNWNSGAENVLGWSADEMRGRSMDEIFTPEDRRENVPAVEMRNALDIGRGVDERWHLRKGGERFFAQGEMMALRYDGGQPLGFVKILRDRTEQQRLVDRLKTSERHNAALVELGDRLRDLATVPDITLMASEILGRTLDVALVGYGIVDPGAETITVERDWTADRAPSLAGALRFRDFGCYIGNLKRDRIVIVTDVRNDPRTSANAATLEARSARAFVNMPVFERGAFMALLYVNAGQPRTWSSEELAFIRNVADRVRTTTARAEAEQQQKVLNAELSHRLKNMFAMIQAIASQTLKGLSERDAVAAFNERLVALSKAHDLLLQQDWESAPIEAVIGGALVIHADPHRFDIGGPDLRLNSRAVLSMALLLHELATNAAKYGALAAPGGTVRLRWAVTGQDAQAELTMTWIEQGGPAVVEPTRRGFGSRLIRTGLAGTGQADLRFDATGLHAAFRAPLHVVTDLTTR